MPQAPKHLLLLGAGGHARSVADVASRLPWVAGVAFVDAHAHAAGVTDMLGYAVWPTLEAAFAEREDCVLHLAIGNGGVRARLAQEIRAAHPAAVFAALVAASATLGREAVLEEGCFLGEGAHVGPRARIGAHSIVNTHAVVEHDVQVGAYSHVSVGAVLAGTSAIGAHAMLGAAAVVRDGIRLGDRVVVGAGGVVVRDIAEEGTYAGVPVRRVK